MKKFIIAIAALGIFSTNLFGWERGELGYVCLTAQRTKFVGGLFPEKYNVYYGCPIRILEVTSHSYRVEISGHCQDLYEGKILWVENLVHSKNICK